MTFDLGEISIRLNDLNNFISDMNNAHLAFQMAGKKKSDLKDHPNFVSA